MEVESGLSDRGPLNRVKADSINTDTRCFDVTVRVLLRIRDGTGIGCSDRQRGALGLLLYAHVSCPGFNAAAVCSSITALSLARSNLISALGSSTFFLAKMGAYQPSKQCYFRVYETSLEAGQERASAAGCLK